MKSKKSPEERQVARTTVVTTDADKKDYADYCRSIGTEVSSRLRDFMAADMAEWRANAGK